MAHNGRVISLINQVEIFVYTLKCLLQQTCQVNLYITLTTIGTVSHEEACITERDLSHEKLIQTFNKTVKCKKKCTITN